MIDPAFKDSFKRPLLTEFEAEALYYLALGLSNWAIGASAVSLCVVSRAGWRRFTKSCSSRPPRARKRRVR